MKLFPAGDFPMKYIRSLKGPFDGTEYVAVGGVNLDNARDFIENGFAGVGIGSNLMPKEFIQNKDWERAAKYIADRMKSI